MNGSEKLLGNQKGKSEVVVRSAKKKIGCCLQIGNIEREACKNCGSIYFLFRS